MMPQEQMTPHEYRYTLMVQAVWDGLALEQRHSAPGGADKPPMPVHFVYLNLGGQCDFWQQRDGRTRHHIQPYGNAVFMPAGCESRWKWRTSTTVLALLIEPELVRRTAAETGRPAPELVSSFGASDPRLLHLGLALKEEALTGGSNGPLFVQCLSTALAAHLLAHYSAAASPISTDPTSTGHGLSAFQLARVTDYVRSNLGADLSLAEIAAVAHASPFHLARLFKRATGKTLHQFVIDCRVDAAKRLLNQDTLSVGQIAGEVGFAQQSHLAAHFKRVTGLSPLAFRRQLGMHQLGTHDSAYNAQEFD